MGGFCFEYDSAGSNGAAAAINTQFGTDAAEVSSPWPTAFALLSLLFVLKFIEETKGKQLEDMHA